MNIRSVVFVIASMVFPVAAEACTHVGMLLGAGVCPQCGAVAAGTGYAPSVALGASYGYGAVAAPLPAAVAAPACGAVGLDYGATIGAGVGTGYGYGAMIGAPVSLGYGSVGLGGYGAMVGLGVPVRRFGSVGVGYGGAVGVPIRHFGAAGVGYGGAVGVPFGAAYGTAVAAPTPVVFVGRPGLINRFRGAIRGFRRGF